MTDDARMHDDLAGLSPDQAAARLLLEINEADPVQAARLDAWLDRAPAHREAWLRAQALWDSFDGADDHRPLDLPRRRARTLRGRSVAPWALAAACLAAAAGLVWVLEPWRPVVKPPPSVQSYAFEAADRIRLIDLPDGSKASLAAHSALTLTYAPSERRLRLVRGHVFFDVAHQAARPFVVEAGGRRITALGTRFDVRSDAEGLQVTLLEGRVRVDSPSLDGPQAAVELRPGEELVAAPGRAPTVGQADAAKAEAWRQTRLVFEDRPLREVIAELNRYAVLQLVIDDPRVAALRITGQFRTGDNARFARNLSRLHPVRAVPDGPDRLKLVRTD